MYAYNYMCVCNYVCIHVFMLVHMHANVYAYRHSLYACIRTCRHTWIHACIHTYINIYIHIHIHTHMHTYTHAYIIFVFTEGFVLVRGGLEGFVRGGFCPFPLLPEYIRYNRKLNITFYFRFHMTCMIQKVNKSMTSHALDTPPPVTTCHTFSDPSPSSVTYFMDGPKDSDPE